MNTAELARLHALETKIASTSETERAPLIFALERLVDQAQFQGLNGRNDVDTLDEDFFDNMPV